MSETKDDFKFAFQTVFHTAIATFPVWMPLMMGPDKCPELTKFVDSDPSWFPVTMLIGAFICAPLSIIVSMTK